jgi:putative methionine-R-sulfoxide reductase with GAF domain
MVLNIGSADLAGFDTFDQAGLENIIRLIERRYFR